MERWLRKKNDPGEKQYLWEKERQLWDQLLVKEKQQQEKEKKLWELERSDSVPGLFGLLDLANFWTVASG